MPHQHFLRHHTLGSQNQTLQTMLYVLLQGHLGTTALAGRDIGIPQSGPTRFTQQGLKLFALRLKFSSTAVFRKNRR